MALRRAIGFAWSYVAKSILLVAHPPAKVRHAGTFTTVNIGHMRNVALHMPLEQLQRPCSAVTYKHDRCEIHLIHITWRDVCVSSNRLDVGSVNLRPPAG